MLVDRRFRSKAKVTIGDEYDSAIKKTKDDFEDLIQEEHADPAHVNHLPALMFGVLLGIMGLVAIFSQASNFFDDYFMPGVFAVIAFSSFAIAFAKRQHFSAVYLIAGAAILLSAYTFYQGQIQFSIPLLIFGAVVSLFTYLMPAPKQAGQKLIREIEGFKLYLSKAEHESLKRLKLPEKTPQLYEELLPYAIALDLETQWSDQFVAVLAKAKEDGTWNNRHHSGWYHGGGSFNSASSFAPAIAAGLATSVVAAATPPRPARSQ